MVEGNGGKINLAGTLGLRELSAAYVRFREKDENLKPLNQEQNDRQVLPAVFRRGQKIACNRFATGHKKRRPEGRLSY